VTGNDSHRDTPAHAVRPLPAMTVADVMTPSPFTLPADAPVRTAAKALFRARVGGAPVVDNGGRLVGVVSEHDLLEKEAHTHLRWRGAAAAARRRTATTAGQICTRPARTITPEQTLHTAARRMIDEHIARLVVVDHDTVVGIITRHDVLAVLIRDDEQLATAIRQTLCANGAQHLKIHVDDGTVTLRGVVHRRTQHGDVLGAVELIDGVVHIDDHVRWRVDDITLRASHPHP
jgi:CBS domain-containing protein